MEVAQRHGVDGLVDGKTATERRVAGHPTRLRFADGPDQVLDRGVGIGEGRRRRRLRHAVGGDATPEAELVVEVGPQAGWGRLGGGHHRVQRRQVVRPAPGRLDDGEAHGGDEQRLVDPVTFDGLEGRFRVEGGLEHDAARRQQRREHALHVGEDMVERQGEEDAPAVLEGPAVRRAVGAAQLHVVGRQHTFGPAGGPRGVEDGGHGVRVPAPPGQLGVECRVGRPREVGEGRHAPSQPGAPVLGHGDDQAQADEARHRSRAIPAGGHPVERPQGVDLTERLHGDEHRRLAVLEDRRELLRLEAVADRHGDGAHPRHGEAGRHELRPVRQHQRHPVPGGDPGGQQTPGEAPAPLRHLAVGGGHPFADDPGAVRVGRGDAVEGAVERGRSPGPVARLQGFPVAGDLVGGRHGSSSFACRRHAIAARPRRAS